MGLRKKLKPNTRILLVFFVAILFIAAVQVYVYGRIFTVMGNEERTINAERMNSAAIKLDVALDAVFDGYMEMLHGEQFSAFNGVQPVQSELLQLYREADDGLGSTGYVRQWAVFLKGCSQILTASGIMPVQDYVNHYCVSPGYDTAFWAERLGADFVRLYYPVTEFRLMGNTGSYETAALVPVVMKPYLNDELMTVVLLDMEAVLAQDDPYLDSGMYIFSPRGELLYTNDAAAHITAVPAGESVTGADGEEYAIYSRTGRDGLVYVKLLPESQAAEVLQNSAVFSLAALSVAVAVATVLMLPAVRRTLHPVNSMMQLLQQHSELENTNDLHGAHSELEQILRSREQQAADLAQKNAALSEYALHSRLKNVYVAMEEAETREDANAYILYIQVQYRETMRGYFSMTRAELENCLQEMLSGALNRLFETTLIFQLEPGRFAAKVTLPPPETKIGDRLDRFLDRLENEKDFASFTVVRSAPLANDDDLAQIYIQVQEAARQAVVCDKSQLLTLPMEARKTPEYEYPRSEEQKLYTCVQEGRTEDAVAVVRQVLEGNLRRGISHVQMEVLCVAMVNTASYAITELAPSAEKIAAASGVYNTLTSKCLTARDYSEAVIGFIRTATATSDVQDSEDDQLLKKVQQYLKDNYQREFSGEEMAKALWVSRSYLSSYYKSKTGMNLSDSIQLFRIQKAVELLKNPGVRIGDIGPMVGIPSTNTFLRQFKKYTGMTPKEYRQKEAE